MTPGAVFVRNGERYRATELARGPWDPAALHGGAPAALLARVIQDSAPDPALALARMTYEFVRPVPIGELSVQVTVVRPGRRVNLLDTSLFDPEGTEVTRARALLVSPSRLGQPSPPPLPFPGPEEGRANDWARGDRADPMFATDAMEIRFVEGAFGDPGPSTAWFRLRRPLVAGQPTSALERLAAAADFGNGIASVLSWEEHVFINPDLTLYVEREPEGEWVALQSQMRVGLGSVATAESVLWDQRGRVGMAIQSLLVSHR